MEVTTVDDAKQENMVTNSRDVSSETVEWRIPTSGGPARFTTEFRNSDFRNPQTGESILPTQVYVELVRDIEAASDVARWKMMALMLVLYLLVVLVPFLVLISNTSYSLFLSAGLFIISMIAAYFVGRKVRAWIYRSLDSRMDQLVQGRIASFSEYGIDMGYYYKVDNRSWNDSHIWLRRQPQEDSTSTIHSSPQNFPAIYLNMLVPGDIHLDEKEYHSNMIMDVETWTMIKHVHFATVKPYRCMAMTMVGVAIIWLVYTIFISWFIYLIGNAEAWLIYLAFVASFIIAWCILDQLRMNSYRKVTDQVNELFLSSEDHRMAGYSLELVTTALPFRTRHMSRRYQLVRRVDSENITSIMQDQMIGSECEIV